MLQNNLQNFMQGIDIRRQRLVLAGILLLVCALVFTYFFIPEIKQYKSLLATRSVLEQAAPAGPGLEMQLATLQSRVDDLKQQLMGDTANLPANQMESYIIGRLQKVSWNNNIELVSVQPDIGKKVHRFKEILFKVELSADYYDFFNWLKSLEKELGFIVVRQFEIKGISTQKNKTRLSMFLTMVSYRVDQQ